MIIAALGCRALAAQTSENKEGDPITDKLRLEIARTQRDLLLADARMREAIERYNAAKAETEGLQKALAEKVAEATKACGDKQAFDAGKLACVAKSAPAKDK